MKHNVPSLALRLCKIEDGRGAIPKGRSAVHLHDHWLAAADAGSQGGNVRFSSDCVCVAWGERPQRVSLDPLDALNIFPRESGLRGVPLDPLDAPAVSPGESGL